MSSSNQGSSCPKKNHFRQCPNFACFWHRSALHLAFSRVFRLGRVVAAIDWEAANLRGRFRVSACHHPCLHPATAGSQVVFLNLDQPVPKTCRDCLALAPSMGLGEAVDMLGH